MENDKLTQQLHILRFVNMSLFLVLRNRLLLLSVLLTLKTGLYQLVKLAPII